MSQAPASCWGPRAGTQGPGPQPRAVPAPMHRATSRNGGIPSAGGAAGPSARPRPSLLQDPLRRGPCVSGAAALAVPSAATLLFHESHIRFRKQHHKQAPKASQKCVINNLGKWLPFIDFLNLFRDFF